MDHDLEKQGHGEVVTVDDDDGAFSVSGDSDDANSPRGLTVKQKAAKEERATLGKKETRAIFCLRVVVLLTFFLVGIASASTVYYFVIDGQEEEFVKQFGYYSDQVIQRFHDQLERKLSSSDTLSADVTSYALASGNEFPFVTVPYFSEKGATARISGDTVMTFYMPYITQELKTPWEEYAAANRGHISEAYQRERESKIAQDELFGLETPGLGDFDMEAMGTFDADDVDPNAIWYTGENKDTGELGPYFPVWHLTPLLPPIVDIVNLDMGEYDFLNGALNAAASSGAAVFGVVTDLTSNEDGETTDAAVFDLILQSGQYRHSKERYSGDPMSPLIYPVFDTFDSDQDVAGFLFTAIYWRFMMQDILPQSVNGIICILENSAGQKHSYEIRGPEVIYLGEKDAHDTQFDFIGKSVDLVKYLQTTAGPETRSFTAAQINDDFLNYTLRVYPTTEFEEIFLNGEAATEAIGISIIFAIAISIFILYDCCVQKRQRIVLDRAVRATAVVSSLYPENVREQIINDDANDESKSRKRKQVFLRSEVSGSALSAPPLATKYLNCTVYFADLAGFTKWSSARQPEQVFQLLEALFKEFDAVAIKRGVYKVETIGDCYMAVTGLPNEQPDHAVIMAKFAHECMVKLDEVVDRLTPILGEGTDNLALRTGIHSGEVTGGVLRGEKGRFQLFGDTVNTASRMESNGIPRKIQLSQSTADALIMQGKGSWLVPRREKVIAKGKGEMQTYFLEIKDRSDKAPSSARSSETPTRRSSSAQ